MSSHLIHSLIRPVRLLVTLAVVLLAFSSVGGATWSGSMKYTVWLGTYVSQETREHQSTTEKDGVVQNDDSFRSQRRHLEGGQVDLEFTVVDGVATVKAAGRVSWSSKHEFEGRTAPGACRTEDQLVTWDQSFTMTPEPGPYEATFRVEWLDAYRYVIKFSVPVDFNVRSADSTQSFKCGAWNGGDREPGGARVVTEVLTGELPGEVLCLPDVLHVRKYDSDARDPDGMPRRSEGSALTQWFFKHKAKEKRWEPDPLPQYAGEVATWHFDRPRVSEPVCEVHFRSELSVNQPVVSMTSEVTATIPVGGTSPFPRHAETGFYGRAAMTYVKFTISPPPDCTIVRIETSAGQAQVSTLQYHLKDDGTPHDLEVWLLIGPSKETVTARCPDSHGDRVGEFLHFHTLFAALHTTASLQSLPGTYLFDDWEILNDPKVIARKVIDRPDSASGGMVSERTVLEVRRIHR